MITRAVIVVAMAALVAAFLVEPGSANDVSAICMVQTETGTAFRSSPAREQQFRGDPFLLG
jgi:hypothetical protein